MFYRRRRYFLWFIIGFCLFLLIHDEPPRLSSRSIHQRESPVSCMYCDIQDLSVPVKANIPCRHLKLTKQPWICLHRSKDDIYVSSSLWKYGVWEHQIVSIFRDFLLKTPSAAVVDVGANLGLYSLVAASLGRRVIAIEPLPENIQRIHKSVVMNRFEDRMTLVKNAVSDRRGSVELSVIPGNKGAASLDKNIFKNSSNVTSVSVQAIYLDDLLPLMLTRNISQAFMKMDIEGLEHIAFGKATKLFQKILFPFIFMEFAAQRFYCNPLERKPKDEENYEKSEKMFEFFKAMNYTRVFKAQKPYISLEPSLCSPEWPKDVIWVHSSQTFPPVATPVDLVWHGK